jgi:hypothetical protein
MLSGVPGTGTREGGLSGSMLKATLDGVVLIRFHAMCLRITALATALFVVIIMPVYLSAQCYRLSEEEALSRPGCASVSYNLTNYEKTTLANVPSLLDTEAYSTIANPGHDGILARLYAVCFCFWILCGKYIVTLLSAAPSILYSEAGNEKKSLVNISHVVLGPNSAIFVRQAMSVTSCVVNGFRFWPCEGTPASKLVVCSCPLL